MEAQEAHAYLALHPFAPHLSSTPASPPDHVAGFYAVSLCDLSFIRKLPDATVPPLVKHHAHLAQPQRNRQVSALAPLSTLPPHLTIPHHHMQNQHRRTQTGGCCWDVVCRGWAVGVWGVRLLPPSHPAPAANIPPHLGGRQVLGDEVR